jgi:hypothetical protein
MTFPHHPPTGGEVHADAIQRLDSALDEQARVERENEDAQGTSGAMSTGVDLAAANEQVAARQAWLGYVEREI